MFSTAKEGLSGATFRLLSARLLGRGPATVELQIGVSPQHPVDEALSVSRYCGSDRLAEFAAAEFRGLNDPIG